MYFAEAHFDDFELFHEAALNWELDFRLLSRNGFKGYLSIYTTENIQIAHTRLNGKIEQHGLIPKGFSSVVIPVNPNMNYNWLHKDVNGSQILIFPSNGVLDSISFDGFDVFVISIENNTLIDWLEQLKYQKASSLFGGDERFILANPGFLQSFKDLVESFLEGISNVKNSNKVSECLILDEILSLLFRFLENGNQAILPSPGRKRDRVLKRSLEIIQSDIENIPNIKGLCKELNVSQRTLEYAFFEKFKVSPKQYIKAQKLHRVKKDILSEQFKNLSIFEIAARYGFWHMGQFAADFKNHFGVLPSELKKIHFK